MPLFYFDLKDGDATAVDEIGTQLPDLLAAVVEAQRVLNDFNCQAAEDPAKSYLSGMVIEIRDETGNVTEVAPSHLTKH